MSISSLNAEITTLRNKITECNTFISQLNDLRGDVSASSNNLKASGDTLREGLLLDNEGADRGKLRELALQFDSFLGDINSAITSAKDNIKAFNTKIESLQKEIERLKREEERERERRRLKNKYKINRG